MRGRWHNQDIQKETSQAETSVLLIVFTSAKPGKDQSFVRWNGPLPEQKSTSAFLQAVRVKKPSSTIAFLSYAATAKTRGIYFTVVYHLPTSNTPPYSCRHSLLSINGCGQGSCLSITFFSFERACRN